MFKIVKASEGYVRQITEHKLATNLITKAISPEVSLSTTQSTSPDYYEKETTPYNRIYYVIEGELTLLVADQKAVLQKGDACFLTKHTTYEMSGQFTAVTVNQPAFGS